VEIRVTDPKGEHVAKVVLRSLIGPSKTAVSE
jgi:hypothetical protein